MLTIRDFNEVLEISKALSSEIRLKIIELLIEKRTLNMKELAQALNVTNGALTSHIKQLSDCGIVAVSLVPGKRGSQKVCRLQEDKFLIEFVPKNQGLQTYQVELNVGQYSDYNVYPTCGLATTEKIIGEMDNPQYFADPEHIKASIVWFTQGYIEYRIPNYLKPEHQLVEMQFSMEISSEAPGICEDWPSDITFYINRKPIGSWTSPGDFGAKKRGFYTPSWWVTNWNQYGLLKLISITHHGTYIDGNKISDVSISDLNLNSSSDILLRIGIPSDAKNVGGLTLFGKNFGDYNQGIRVWVIYK